MSLKVNIEKNGIDQLKKQIDYVNKMIQMKTDTSFQKYIQNKVLETADMITRQELKGGTTNDNEIDLYKTSHKIREIKNGFELYNDAQIPANQYNILPFDTSGYPSGMFSIALAFEYGVGITGINTYGTDSNYVYDDISNSKSSYHKYYKRLGVNAWYLPKNVYGKSGVLSTGYEGFEIYRKIREEVEKNLKDWVNEYFAEQKLRGE